MRTQEDITIVKGLIEVNPETFETGVSGIFAGGDTVAFPGAIIESVRAARAAASSIDRFLGGDGDITDCFVQKNRLHLLDWAAMKTLPARQEKKQEKSR